MEYREELRSIGERILSETRTELYLTMHFLGPALGSLSPVMDLSTTTVGTDAAFIRFNPKCLMTKYIEHPYWLKRCYLHILLHCLFRHMFAGKAYDDIWELRPGNNCVLYFISKPYTSKNGKQEENHSFHLLSRYHIPSRFYQSGPFQSTDATPGLKRCMIESESRSDPDKDSDIFINRQAAEEVIYRQARIITLRYRKSK